MPEARIIKRYANRKLYDTEHSRYVTLDQISEMIRNGDDVKIVDNKTKEDLTTVTLAQIIFEEEKRKSGLLSLPVLRWIIHQGDEALHEILERVERGREVLDSARESVEKGVQQLVGRGRPGGKGLLGEILEAPQKQLDHLQKRIDTQVRESVDRLTAHPAIQHEITRLEKSVKRLEQQLVSLKRRPSRARRNKPAT